jgi:3-oxoacyl-[acyl-carrier protein] reductase
MPDLAGRKTSVTDFWLRESALGRLPQPNDIADVIAFLVSDDVRFISGQRIRLDDAAMQQP